MYFHEGEQAIYNLLQGPVSSGFIFLLDIMQMGTKQKPQATGQDYSLILKQTCQNVKWTSTFEKDHYDNDLRIRADKSGSWIVYIKKTQITVEYIDKQWKSLSECTETHCDLGL